jgi:N6-L-threonylcarbamoyladenine synthase
VSKEEPKILGIESSCDDTGAAILAEGKILANVVYSQTMHQKYGGVVPEIASRAHLQKIVPVVQEALEKAGLSLQSLDAIAYTRGPGLMGSLMVGSSFAKGLALAAQLPLIPVQHMQAHILAHFIPHEGQSTPSFPFLNLTVSGGHTQLVLVKNALDMEILGETKDDAMGEAFDKAAKIMGLPYPGGPLIDRYAQEGDALKYEFPRPKTPDLDFSFSGMKTSFLYFIQRETENNPNFVAEHLNDICASWQHALVRYVMKQLIAANEIAGCKHVAISGGVSANSGLQRALKEEGAKRGWQVHIPPLAYSTDNAAMIAMAGKFLYEAKKFGSMDDAVLSRMDW